MRRREFITLLGAAAAWPLAAGSQQPERMRRIGVLMNRAVDNPEGHDRLAAFHQGLQEMGWGVGRNVRIDTRWSENSADQSACGIGRPRARHHLGQRHLGSEGVATYQPHFADRIRGRRRSGRRRLGR
jgi:hypothetical protein